MKIYQNPLWYVIPTYWTEDEAGSFSSIYDHPTPINGGESTLPRLLNSILKAFSLAPETKANILIIISTVNPESNLAAVKQVRKICASYMDSLSVFFAGEEIIFQLVDAAPLLESNESLFRNGLRGYGDVRNLQLILPAIFGAKWIFAVDDDELISQETAKRIHAYTKKELDFGIAGIYHNHEGRFLVSEPETVENVLKDKAVFMNETFRGLQVDEKIAIEELPLSPIALGGNMFFPASMFKNIPFDPYITRGEDIDYLMNARAFEKCFRFDHKLTITHLPPRQYESDAYGKMKADIFRFIYERAKLEYFGLSAKDFYPYPGRLLEENFDFASLVALRDLETPARVKTFGSPEKILAEAKRNAFAHLEKFESFCEDWKQYIKQWENDILLRESLLRKLI